jgi:hypothetical protein
MVFTGSGVVAIVSVFGFTVFLGLASSVLETEFYSKVFADSESGVFASGLAALFFVASESSVLLERFFTLNGLGVVVE